MTNKDGCAQAFAYLENEEKLLVAQLKKLQARLRMVRAATAALQSVVDLPISNTDREQAVRKNEETLVANQSDSKKGEKRTTKRDRENCEDAGLRILYEAGGQMHYKDLLIKLQEAGFLNAVKNPEAAMRAHLSNWCKNDSVFKLDHGRFLLDLTGEPPFKS